MAATPTELQKLADAATDPNHPVFFGNASGDEHAQIFNRNTRSDFHQQHHFGIPYAHHVYVSPSSAYNAHTACTGDADNQLPGSNELYPTRADGRQGPFAYRSSSLQQPGFQTTPARHFTSPNATPYNSPDATPYNSPDATPYNSPDATPYNSPDATPYNSPDVFAHPAPPTSNTSHRLFPPQHNDVWFNPCQPNNLYPTLPPLPDVRPAGSRTEQLPTGTTRCEWDGGCEVALDDTSPSGIGRHLRQCHDVVMIDNRTRGECQWGDGCAKAMFPTNLGKHIAECHLRNMVKQCPYCLADFARADTLTRHMKGFCTYLKALVDPSETR